MNTESNMSEYEYWTTSKTNYLNNLKNGIGHRDSILAIVKKIDEKLENICKDKQ